MNTNTIPAAIENQRSSRRLRRQRFYCRSTGTQRPQDLREIKRNRIIVGDALGTLRTLPSDSVDCVITSPPYFLLRNYGVEDQIGAETNVKIYVKRIVSVGDEVARVLKPTGAFWLNLGDSYSRHDRYGAAPKSLLLAPERILLELAERGWTVRNKVVWAKPNPMPSSVGDRLSCSWEPLYLLVRSASYFFDLDAIREPHRTTRKPARQTPYAKYGGKRPAWAGPLAGANDGLTRAQAEGRVGHRRGKNPADVWAIATAGFRGAHFATFPPRLVERPILATVPERVCDGCGRPWRRVDDRVVVDCACRTGWQAGLVLDPFMGAGTVAIAAEARKRDWLGIELSPASARLADQRIEQARARRPDSNVLPAAEAA
jgi:site-specific DNA-methyltransferase (adenine-specific)